MPTTGNQYIITSFTVTNYYRFPWFYYYRFPWFFSLFASSWTHSQTLQNYCFPFCSVTLHCACHCTHNFVDSSSGCYVIETMYISHQWSSKTNYFSSQNKYLSSGMPIKSSNYTLKKCSFQIHYLKTVYYRCSSFNVYLSGKWFSWVTQRRQNIINYLNIYNIVFCLLLSEFMCIESNSKINWNEWWNNVEFSQWVKSCSETFMCAPYCKSTPSLLQMIP